MPGTMPENKSRHSSNIMSLVFPFPFVTFFHSLLSLKFNSEMDLSVIGPKIYILLGTPFEKEI